MKLTCPYCKNDSPSLIEKVTEVVYLCGVCSKLFKVTNENFTQSSEASSGTTENKNSTIKRSGRD